MIGVRSGIDEYGQPAEEILSGYVGEFKYFGFETVPPHCLACDGSEISRETYNELFAVFGTMYGAGNGTTTFNLPDFRGAFFRCAGGNAATMGTAQPQEINTTALRMIGQRAMPSSGRYSDSIAKPMAVDRANSGDNMFMFNANLGVEDGFWAIDAEGNCIGSTEKIGNIPADWTVISTGNVFWLTRGSETRPENYAVNVCVVFE